MRRTVMMGALALGLGLSACEGGGNGGSADYAVADMSMAEPVLSIPGGPKEATEAAATSADESPSDPSIADVQPVSAIAYSYRYALELPSDQVPSLRSRHEAACVEAGPRVCQLLGSESQA